MLVKTNSEKKMDSKRKNYELLKEHEEGKTGKKGLQPGGTTGMRTGRSIHSKKILLYVNVSNRKSEPQLKRYRMF